MASNVEIANRALQILGQDRISALTDNTENARRVNAIFEDQRDLELMSHPWVFAVERTSLAADATGPDWGRDNSFTLPADFLALYPQYPEDNDPMLDWEIEGNKIITDDAGPIYIRYIKRVTDPTLFGPLFREALSCRLALALCEQITASGTLKESVREDHKRAIAEARLRNAIARKPIDAVESSWIYERR